MGQGYRLHCPIPTRRKALFPGCASPFPLLLSKACSQAGEGHEFVTETQGAGVLLHVTSDVLLPLFLLTTPSSDGDAPEIGKHL